MTKRQSNPQFSLSKDKIRVLLLEGVNDSAVAMMKVAGYSSVTRLSKALDGDALKQALKGVHLLGIRSRTEITGAMSSGVMPRFSRRLATPSMSSASRRPVTSSPRPDLPR